MIPLRYTHNSLYNLAYTIYEPNRVDSSRMLPPPPHYAPLTPQISAHRLPRSGQAQGQAVCKFMLGKFMTRNLYTR
ncbi:hypothetical protein ACLKA6_008857 [Drosophila palustris]